jgi:hypothetical protein
VVPGGRDFLIGGPVANPSFSNDKLFDELSNDQSGGKARDRHCWSSIAFKIS